MSGLPGSCRSCGCSTGRILSRRHWINATRSRMDLATIFTSLSWKNPDSICKGIPGRYWDHPRPLPYTPRPSLPSTRTATAQSRGLSTKSLLRPLPSFRDALIIP